jgi:hypothetical protein
MIVLANLDCEARWAQRPLPAAVARRISAAGMLLGALAPTADPVEVWTPAAIDPARVHLPGVALRAGVPSRWDLAWADPDAKAANDRRLALAIHAELGTVLPGARAVASLAELDAHLAGGGARAGVDHRWVCKAPWTAAGRDRAHGQGDAATGELRVYLGRLLAHFGALLFEPWLDRVLDTGVCATIDRAGRVTAAPPHTLISDERGGFRGIELAAPALAPDERAALDRAVTACGAKLARLGYAGPFGVDAFAYRDAAGERRFHALCELNARHTFGHVARALGDRLGVSRLGFGSPPAGARVLVAPGDGDPIAAWIA